MTQILLDASVSSQLHKLTHAVELCDAAGRVLGRFVPWIAAEEVMLVWPDFDCLTCSPVRSSEEVEGELL